MRRAVEIVNVVTSLVTTLALLGLLALLGYVMLPLPQPACPPPPTWQPGDPPDRIVP